MFNGVLNMPMKQPNGCEMSYRYFMDVPIDFIRLGMEWSWGGVILVRPIWTNNVRPEYAPFSSVPFGPLTYVPRTCHIRLSHLDQ